MAKLRVHNLSIALDGYVAGPNQRLDDPIGVGGSRLHEWALATRTFRAMQGSDGGNTGLDDDLTVQGDVSIGTTIMGRKMLGPIRGS